MDRRRARQFVLHPTVVPLPGANRSGSRQMAALGTSAVPGRNVPVRGGLGGADRIHLRRREASADAVRSVVAAGGLRSECDWDDLVLHPPRPSAEAVPGLRAYRKDKLPILSALRHVTASNLPEMR